MPLWWDQEVVFAAVETLFLIRNIQIVAVVWYEVDEWWWAILRMGVITVRHRAGGGPQRMRCDLRVCRGFFDSRQMSARLLYNVRRYCTSVRMVGGSRINVFPVLEYISWSFAPGS